MNRVYDRISIDPRVCHGQACIRGTRIPVHQIVRMLANGDTVEGLLEDYPSLEREDISAALNYADEEEWERKFTDEKYRPRLTAMMEEVESKIAAGQFEPLDAERL